MDIYCTKCHDKIIVHANGDVMCGCEAIDFDINLSTEAIQNTWEVSDEDAERILRLMRNEYLNCE
jgi:hypothetical protein